MGAPHLKVIMIGDGVAIIYVPIIFTTVAPGQSGQQTRSSNQGNRRDPNESAVSEYAKRLESFEHPDHTSAYPITLARHIVSKVLAARSKREPVAGAG